MFVSYNILYAYIISNMNDMDKYIGSILWDNLVPVETPVLPFLWQIPKYSWVFQLLRLMVSYSDDTSSYYHNNCFPFVCLRNGGVTIYLSTVANSSSENICRKNKCPTIYFHITYVSEWVCGICLIKGPEMPQNQVSMKTALLYCIFARMYLWVIVGAMIYILGKIL